MKINPTPCGASNVSDAVIAISGYGHAKFTMIGSVKEIVNVRPAAS